MKSLEAIIEFAALAIIGLMLLTFFENAMAANANAQASANRPRHRLRSCRSASTSAIR